jgi:hypothetical protein
MFSFLYHCHVILCVITLIYDNESFTFYVGVFFPLSLPWIYRTWLYIWVTRRVSYKKQQLLTVHMHLSSSTVFWGGPCCSSFCVVILCVLTFSVQCCDVRYNFHINTMNVGFYLQLFVGELVSYLRYSCLFVGGLVSYLRYWCLFVGELVSYLRYWCLFVGELVSYLRYWCLFVGVLVSYLRYWCLFVFCLSCVLCLVSCVLCLMSCVLCLVSCVLCLRLVSCVLCLMSYVLCLRLVSCGTLCCQSLRIVHFLIVPSILSNVYL